MNAPPDYVIEVARRVGALSPCAKSKRGVVLFNQERADRVNNATGIEPASEIERFRDEFVIVSRGFNGPPVGFGCANTGACRSNCAAVCMHAEQRAILTAVGADDVADLELVHVKVMDGAVVAGGPPSCLQCSRLVVEVALRGVWLYELPTVARANAAGVTRGDDPRHAELAEWRFYNADEFHRTTLANNGLAALAPGVDA